MYGNVFMCLRLTVAAEWMNTHTNTLTDRPILCGVQCGCVLSGHWKSISKLTLHVEFSKPRASTA